MNIIRDPLSSRKFKLWDATKERCRCEISEVRIRYRTLEIGHALGKLLYGYLFRRAPIIAFSGLELPEICSNVKDYYQHMGTGSDVKGLALLQS